LLFFFAILLLRVGSETFAGYKLPTALIDTSARLLTAWLIIRLTTGMLKDSNWSRILSVAAWLIAALHILNLLIPVINLLDQLAIDLGGVRISLLLLIKGVIVFTVLLKIASNGSSLLEKRILSFEELTPSVQVLLSKALKITLLAVAVIVALSSLGINLSAFAFIGGAIGVGIGFGLQKVVSNLVSGIILLLDRSIKPGDVIEIGSTYGRIQSLGARYVSVATRDKTEYLIPNEDLITTQVINWSFSDKLVRLKIVVGVSYDSDIHMVMRLMVEAAATIPRVLANPQPVCQLKNFGDSSVDMELRIWIDDPENGISNVSSAVRVAVWDAFKEHGIEIPYPQRDVHIKSQPI
jgi:small-conductance mechanosensitive channel